MTLKAYVIVSCILFVILAGFVYKDSKIERIENREKNYTIQDNVESIGYESGKKVYNIKIKKVLQKSYRHILYVNELIDGSIYNNDETIVVKNITGTQGRVNTHLKSLLVTGNISALIEPTTSTKSISVQAHGFRYNNQKKQSSFFNNIILNVSRQVLSAPKFNYDTNSETVIFPEILTITTEHSKTLTNQAIINVKNSQIITTQNIETEYFKKATENDSDQVKDLLKSKTFIKAKNMSLNFSDNDFSVIDYDTNVIITQDDKKLLSDKLHINFKDNIYKAESNIVLELESLKWSLNKDRKIKNKTINDMLSKKTIIKSNLAKFDHKKNKIFFDGSVIAKQNNFKLTCNSMVYDIKSEKIILLGSVKVYKFGIEHLNTNKIIIDIRNETFTTDSKDKLSEIMIEI